MKDFPIERYLRDNPGSPGPSKAPTRSCASSSLVTYCGNDAVHRRMFTLLNRLAPVMAAAVLLVAFAAAIQAQQPINIEKWPDDVPCEVLKKSPDGTYEITVPWTRFFQTHTGTKYRNTRETKYWDQKCKGLTK